MSKPEGSGSPWRRPVREAVEVCLVDGDRTRPTERRFAAHRAHLRRLARARARRRRGPALRLPRARPYRPWTGLRANPAKILVDPYARQITGTITDLKAARGWVIDPMPGPHSTVDSLGHVPLSVVTAARRARRRARPDEPWSETVIPEAHVRGYTRLHPDVPPEQRGTYLGLAHPAVVEHLRRIGVTAVELLPVTAIARRAPAAATAASPTTGATRRSASSPRTPATRACPARRSRSSARWSTPCTRRASRCSSTSCPTTPARAASTAPRSRYRGLDAPAYYCLRGTATTPTSPAPATPSTPARPP